MRLKQLLPALMLIALAGPLPAETVRLTLLDGTSKDVDVRAISNGKIQGARGAEGLSLDDLQRLDRPDATLAAPLNPAAIVQLHSGRIAATKVLIADEKCQLEWLAGQTASISLDGVRSIRFDTVAPSTEFEKALAVPNAEQDRALLRDEAGALTIVAGLIESLDDQQLTLEVSGQRRTLPRQKLVGLIIAQAAVADSPQPQTVHFVDGSELGGQALALSQGRLTLEVPRAGALQFPLSAVGRIDVRSARVQYLSDLKPLSEEQRPLVTLGFPAGRDRSAAGGRLMLGDQTFEKGLGVHARSELTYLAAGRWSEFAATIGLDPERGEKGDCVFKVVADGEELLARRMRGSDDPVRIRLDVTGRDKITLLVEPGMGLDLADHANWGDARFVRNKQSD